jgi:hypothetical protein
MINKMESADANRNVCVTMLQTLLVMASHRKQLSGQRVPKQETLQSTKPKRSWASSLRSRCLRLKRYADVGVEGSTMQCSAAVGVFKVRVSSADWLCCCGLLDKQKFKQLYELNDPKKGGSFYLQSKIMCAKIRLEEAMEHKESVD